MSSRHRHGRGGVPVDVERCRAGRLTCRAGRYRARTDPDESSGADSSRTLRCRRVENRALLRLLVEQADIGLGPTQTSPSGADSSRTLRCRRVENRALLRERRWRHECSRREKSDIRGLRGRAVGAQPETHGNLSSKYSEKSRWPSYWCGHIPWSYWNAWLESGKSRLDPSRRNWQDKVKQCVRKEHKAKDTAGRYVTRVGATRLRRRPRRCFVEHARSATSQPYGQFV